MKITVKDLADLKAQALAKLKGYQAKGKSEEVAKSLVESWIDDNEFLAEDGTTQFTMTMEDLGTVGSDASADAIGKAVADAIQPLLTAMNTKGHGNNTRQPEVKIIDPVEKMFFDTAAPEFQTWEFKNVGDFAMSLYRHQHPTAKTLDPRLERVLKGAEAFRTGRWAAKATPTTYASELIGADGGFLVPPEYRKEIWTAITAQSEFMNRIDLTPTSSNNVNMAVDQNAPWDNTSGIQVYWRQQAATMTQSKPIFQNRQVPLNELYAFVPATDELLADTPQLNNHLGTKAPAKMTYAIDDGIIRGTGQGQPLGMLINNPSAQTITANATASTGYSVTDLANMYPHMIQPMGVSNEVPSAVWVMTPRSYAFLLTLATGTAGYPLALTNQNIAGRIVLTAASIPIIVSQHVPGYDQAGAVSLVNFEGYKGFNKESGFDFQSSIHLFFDSGATAFRWTYRFGGEPMLRSTITSPNDTGNALSHAVLLGATL